MNGAAVAVIAVAVLIGPFAVGLLTSLVPALPVVGPWLVARDLEFLPALFIVAGLFAALWERVFRDHNVEP